MPCAAGIYYYAFEGGVIETPPIVLIHGAGGNHLYWPPEIRRLTGNRVYAVDLPGHGKSEGYGLQSIAGYAGKLAAWLSAMGLHAAVFVGHSMGGAIALALASDYPEHVAGLGLVSSSARLNVGADILENAAHAATLHKAVEALAAHSFSPATESRLVELATMRMGEIRPSVLHGDLTACTQFDATQQLAAIRAPALVVCGADDRMTPVRSSQFLADSIRSARLVVVPRAGHMVMLEQPQAVAAELGKFVSSLTYHPGESG